MEWDKKDTEALLKFKENVDCDDVRFKERIKEILLDNRFIIHVLHNKELEQAEATPDDYFNTSILPYFALEDTIVDVKNVICYEIAFESNHYNKNEIIKQCQIVFNVICDLDDIIDKETGIARHDLLSALLLDQFNWTNIFGMQIKCVSDKPSMLGANLACRTLIFKGEFADGIAKTRDGRTRVVNSDVITK